MGKHKTTVPWRQLRRKLRELAIEHQQLQRAYRDLEARWSETETERLRLAETYEPSTGTSWGRDLMDVLKERREGRERGEPVTQLIPVVRIGVDPAAGADPSGITVWHSDEYGNQEMIKQLKEWGE